MVRSCFILLLILIQTACAQAPLSEQSRLRPELVGSELSLKQPVQIAANQVAIYLQDGSIKDYALINKYYPHCKFELYHMSEHARSVQPDTFRITAISNRTDLSSTLPMLYASLLVADGDDGGGSSLVSFVTTMMLKSEKQPEVFRMECMHWDDINDPHYLTIEETRSTLGAVFELRVLGLGNK